MFPFLEFAYEHVSKIDLSTLEKHRTAQYLCTSLSKDANFSASSFNNSLFAIYLKKAFPFDGNRKYSWYPHPLYVFFFFVLMQATSSLVTLFSWDRIYGRNTTDIVTKCFRCSWHKHLNDHFTIYYYCFHR